MYYCSCGITANPSFKICPNLFHAYRLFELLI
uniref:Uncharacterized protein n=1 Tax=Arundo donax TaxID=35708 RepID=A0A0A9Q6B0_ARUDO